MMANSDVGKLFIGGLGWETTKECLQNYFSRFGEISDCIVMKNAETGKSRGFGFVTFQDPNCVYTALQAKPHEINGRIVDAKQCTPRNTNKGKRSNTLAKLFIGGLPPDITEADISDVFSRFGSVSNVNIMYDQQTRKCRGFGFLSFESDESIDQACNQRFVNINGKQIECKRAEPRTSGGAGYTNYASNTYGRQENNYWNSGGWNATQYQPQEQGYQSYAPSVGSTYSSQSVLPSSYATPYQSYGNVSYESSTTEGYTADSYQLTSSQYASYPQPFPEVKSPSAVPAYGTVSAGQNFGARGQAYHPYRR